MPQWHANVVEAGPTHDSAARREATNPDKSAEEKAKKVAALKKAVSYGVGFRCRIVKKYDKMKTPSKWLGQVMVPF